MKRAYIKMGVQIPFIFSVTGKSTSMNRKVQIVELTFVPATVFAIAKLIPQVQSLPGSYAGSK